MDELVRAVRDCPSGALSLAFDRVEARDLADWHDIREQAIEITQDGPYRVTGGLPLTDASGADVPRAAGSSREHYALCRCGHSQNKPFCSGMHWYVEFRDPVRPPGAEPTLFEWVGGLPALSRLTRLLYERHVPADDLLAPLFAAMAPEFPLREAAVSPRRSAGRRRATRLATRVPDGRASPRSSAPAGSSWPAGPPTRPCCLPTRSSARRSRPTWSGRRGPVIHPRPHGTGGPPGRPPRHPGRLVRSTIRRRSRCPDLMRR